MQRCEMGVIGGSGLSELVDDFEEVDVSTPFGAPSAPIQISTVEGQRIAFLPRHGKNHEFAPHLVNYRANIWALKSLGISQVIGLCCSGSLQRDIAPGQLVIPDDISNRTYGRPETFVSKNNYLCLHHEHMYCPALREQLIKAGRKVNTAVHSSGTCVVVNGPHLSSCADSRRFAKEGGHIVNMTQYPECILARELQLCYAAISVITDYDIGVSSSKVFRLPEMKEKFRESLPHMISLFVEYLKLTGARSECSCVKDSQEAIVNGEISVGSVCS